MKRTLTIAAKDLRLLLRDRGALFFIIAFPIVMGVFFGLVMGNVGGSGSSGMRLAVVDNDRSPMSEKFIAALDASSAVQAEPMSREQAMDAVRQGRLTGMLVLEAGFGETAGVLWAPPPQIELGIDPSRRAEAGMMEGLVMQAMGSLIGERFADPAALRPLIQDNRQQLQDATDLPPTLRPLLLTMLSTLDVFLGQLDQVQQQQTPEADAEAGSESQPSAGLAGLQLAEIRALDVTRQYKPDSPQALVRKLQSRWDISFPQAILWGAMGCATGFGLSLIRERQQGTLLRLQVSPAARHEIIAGKALACFAALLLVIGGLVVLGMLLGMKVRNPPMLCVSSICLALAFVGIMMLMSVSGRSEEAVGGAVWAINLLMAMFGGCMIPLAFLPGFMKQLSNLSPVKWGVLALEGAIWRGFQWQEVLLPCGVLLGVGAAGVGLSVVLLRRQLA